MKRLLVLSDLHCGHKLGLGPYNKIVWDFYKATLKKLKPVDICAVNGDAIEGVGKKNRQEIEITDMGDQREIAINALKLVKAKDYIFTYGTPYHVTNEEDYEKSIAQEFNAGIKATQIFDINGVRFNMKHHTSKTSIPHGQGTLILKRALWELLKAQISNMKRPDVIIRSHVHEFIQVKNKLGFAITTPSLQLDSSTYGRKIDGWYDIGMVHFDIHKDGSFDFQEHILQINFMNKVVKFE